MSIAIAANAASEAQPGWGKLVALLVAVLVFWAGTEIHKRWKSVQDDHSPTGVKAVSGGANPQVTVVGGTTSGTTVGRGSGAAGQLDTWVGQQVGRRTTMEIVREAQRRFGASKRTVLRAVKRARGQGGAP